MSRSMPGPIRHAFAAFFVLLGAAPAVRATTVCDTAPNVVLFTPTVDPSALNGLLAFLGNQNFTPPPANLTIPGLCTDHQIGISTGLTTLPFGNAPFTVTPSRGSIRVGLTLANQDGSPFEIGIDGGNYHQVNCDSFCVITVPYIGEINGCNIESDIVRPLLSVLHANASWDEVQVTQVADTCVLGDCTAVHPLESSTVNLTNFDINLTGFGSCEVCLPFFPDACLDPCQGLDPLIAALVEPVLENSFNTLLKPKPDEGLLIDVFANDIVHDFICLDIPEVTACKNQNPVAGVVRTPRDHGLNALFYSLPMGVAAVLALRLRRRSAPKPPA